MRLLLLLLLGPLLLPLLHILLVQSPVTLIANSVEDDPSFDVLGPDELSLTGLSIDEALSPLALYDFAWRVVAEDLKAPSLRPLHTTELWSILDIAH